MQRKLLLFDIDGTLVRWKRGRSIEITRRVVRDVLKKELPNGALTSFAGKTDPLIFKEIGDFYSMSDEELGEYLPQLQTKLVEFCADYISPEHIDLLPGVDELLKNLADDESVELGLVTGNLKESAFLKLSSYGLDKYFSHGAFGSDHIERRELPIIAIRRANEKLGTEVFKTDNSVIIGDAPRDIDCAVANCIPVVSVATGESSTDELAAHNPTVVLKDFSDIERSLRALKELR
jgi:phosphoglycolate phosphatase-like HAD superfamily hydrolase